MTSTARWYQPSAKERLGLDLILAEQAQAVAVPPTVRTTAYTLAAVDAGRNVEVNSATGVTVTVPSGVFVAGQSVTISQTGAGLVTLAAGAGLTLSTPTTLKSGGQWATITVTFRSGSTAIVSGGLSAT